MKFEKFETHEGVVDVYIAWDYDPFSPAKPDPVFVRVMEAAMERSEDFRDWVERLGLDAWGPENHAV